MFVSFVAAGLLVAGASAQTFTIATPGNVAECLPLAISWTGGTPPYTLSVADGNAPNGPALAVLSTNNPGTSFSWPSVNFPAGTSLDLNVRDSTGIIAQTAPFPVNPGDPSCLNGGSSSSSSSGSSSASSSSSSSPAPSSSSSSPSPTSPSSSSTPPALSPSSTPSPTRPASSSVSSPASAQSSSTSSNNAAPTRAVSYGAAGVFGAVAAAVLL